MAKDIKFDVDVRDGLKRGIDKLANAVKITLGPKGQNVIIDKLFEPQVTKDGVTVAKEIELEDSLENMGAQTVKQAASRTNDIAGDGTTTATVLAQALIKEGLKNVAAGANPMDLKRGIDKAVNSIVDYLEDISEPVKGSTKKLKQVASISANNDSEIGTLLSQSFDKVGEQGMITVEESSGKKSHKTYIDVVQGMQFDRGYLSSEFLTDREKNLVKFDEPFILITDKKISNILELEPILVPCIQLRRPLLIIAEGFTDSAIELLEMNKTNNGLDVVAVNAPGFGPDQSNILEDIATLTGGVVYSDLKGHSVSTLDLEFLGSCKSITIGKNHSSLVGGLGNKEAIDTRIKEIKSQIDIEESENETIKLKDRLAKLAGGVAIMYVGANTQVERSEKKDRVDDALHATRAAIEEGIVPGGGTALLGAKNTLCAIECENEDEQTGVNIVSRAIESPLRTILENAGVEPSVVVRDILKSKRKNYGYDAKTDKYCDMVKSGIIDPKKVTRVALQNAASVTGMILTTGCALIELNEEDMLENMLRQPEPSMIG